MASDPFSDLQIVVFSPLRPHTIYLRASSGLSGFSASMIPWTLWPICWCCHCFIHEQNLKFQNTLFTSAKYTIHYSLLDSSSLVYWGSSAENQQTGYTCAVYMVTDTRMFTSAFRDGPVVLALRSWHSFAFSFTQPLYSSVPSSTSSSFLHEW